LVWRRRRPRSTRRRKRRSTGTRDRHQDPHPPHRPPRRARHRPVPQSASAQRGVVRKDRSVTAAPRAARRMWQPAVRVWMCRVGSGRGSAADPSIVAPVRLAGPARMAAVSANPSPRSADQPRMDWRVAPVIVGPISLTPTTAVCQPARRQGEPASIVSTAVKARATPTPTGALFDRDSAAAALKQAGTGPSLGRTVRRGGSGCSVAVHCRCGAIGVGGAVDRSHGWPSVFLLQPSREDVFPSTVDREGEGRATDHDPWQPGMRHSAGACSPAPATRRTKATRHATATPPRPTGITGTTHELVGIW
jgi:hypothetical protein